MDLNLLDTAYSLVKTRIRTRMLLHRVRTRLSFEQRLNVHPDAVREDLEEIEACFARMSVQRTVVQNYIATMKSVLRRHPDRADFANAIAIAAPAMDVAGETGLVDLENEMNSVSMKFSNLRPVLASPGLPVANAL